MEPQSPAGAPPAGPSSGLSAQGLLIARISADELVAKRGVAEARIRFEGVGELVDRLLALADGTLDEDAVVEAFAPADRPAARRLVSGLRARGLLQEGEPPDATAAFWRSVASHALGGPARLPRSSVLLIGEGPLADQVASALQDCGVGHVDRAGTARPEITGAAGHLWCAVTTGPAERLLPAADAALGVDAVFLPLWLDDLVIHVGPMTHPYDTACLRCYLLRRESNDPEREVHRMLANLDTPGHGAGYLPAMPAVAAQLAAVEIVKQLAGLPVTTAGRTIELSLVPYHSRVHRVLRVPRCPSCSGVARQSAPVVAHGPQLTE